MAIQTATQRQAAAKRAAATRKRTAAKRSGSSARRTSASASATRLGPVGRQAQRGFFIQVGAAATLGDKIRNTVRTLSRLDRVRTELDRFERRGSRALSRRRRELKRDVRRAQRTVEQRADGLRSDVLDLADQVRELV